jgi:hypothetical protein
MRRSCPWFVWPRMSYLSLPYVGDYVQLRGGGLPRVDGKRSFYYRGAAARENTGTSE